MKHPDTRALYNHWNAIRLTRSAPLRSELSPREMKALLSRLFILQRDTDTCYTYRLAGTELCRYFGRELRGANFLSNWKSNELQSIGSLFQSVAEDRLAAVIGIKAYNERLDHCHMEFVLLPVRLDGTDEMRILGCAGVFEPPAWIGRMPIIRQELTGLRLLWPQKTPRFLSHRDADDGDVELVNPHDEPPHGGQRHGHLWVIDGGAS